jgi:hypothetical protein
MIEVTGNDVTLLGDKDLRTLVGRLCEAELRTLSLPASSVTWGGDQDAADGGIDVRVELPADTPIVGFVPRPATGFQVKKSDMPRAEIRDEMRPRGTIRPSIRDLANRQGAYVIVSSTGSTADPALQDRKAAMAEAVSDLENNESLALDFYDRGRIATWVRCHPGLIPWVREAIGKAIPGWRSYGPWAYEPEGEAGEYIMDEKLRIQTGRKETADGLSMEEGIRQLRDLLREPRNVVRLIGLSGVGKTRLVQALFDDGVGVRSLDRTLALYTNMADGPNPQPTGLASDLIAARSRNILVIDNCPPDLHRRLSDLCRSPGSTVSAITVEYDIREDEPEGTEVFRLDPSSAELIEKLVRHRFPEISEVDARTVAEFSGGNARIAIALAGTIDKRETIAGLTDEELFRRLFQQRHAHDESLLLAAQACSLVYSFEGEDVSQGGELTTLGALIGKTALEVFQYVAELDRRDLVQPRGPWRAVLPQAIANRLAGLALQNIPSSIVEGHLIHGASERLARSFSRRLGYLHESKQAVAIAEKWLAIDGLLGDVGRLNGLGRTMLVNVAPAAPEAALAALERALLGPEGVESLASCSEYIRLVLSIAYDAALFERCAAILLRFATASDRDDRRNEALNSFVSLFFVRLSGTHATIEQRLGVIKPLLLSANARERGVGIKALEAVLECCSCGASHSFEFGARSRDYGYWPRTRVELKRWFGAALEICETLVCSDAPCAARACAVIAEKFRGLWTSAGMHGELEHISRVISQRGFWGEGWIAVRQTQRINSAGFTREISNRLSSLEQFLGPGNLVQEVQAMVLADNLVWYGLLMDEVGGDVAAAMGRAEAVARTLGGAVASDEQAFSSLLSELVTGQGRRSSFGMGLAESATDPKTMWGRLASRLTSTAEGDQNAEVLQGFLAGLQGISPGLVDTILDEAYQYSMLGRWYPALQTAAGIDEKGIERLKRSITTGTVPIRGYHYLALGRAADSIPGQDLKNLVLAIAERPDGFEVAAQILHLRLHSDKDQKRGHAVECIDAGRELMRSVVFARSNISHSYALGMIAQTCLGGDGGIDVAQEVCRRLLQSIAKYEAHAYEHNYLFEGLLTVQPAAVLDVLFASDSAVPRNSIGIIRDLIQHGKNPLDVISKEELARWCDGDPPSRYPTAAAVVTAFTRDDGEALSRWTETALYLLARAPDRVRVLEQFVRRFTQSRWSGSRSTTIESNARLLDELEGDPDSSVAEFIAREKARLASVVQEERQYETWADRRRHERFE